MLHSVIPEITFCTDQCARQTTPSLVDCKYKVLVGNSLNRFSCLVTSKSRKSFCYGRKRSQLGDHSYVAMGSPVGVWRSGKLFTL